MADFTLTTGADTFTGTDGNDTVIGTTFTLNTREPWDNLNGGLGTDILMLYGSGWFEIDTLTGFEGIRLSGGAISSTNLVLGSQSIAVIGSGQERVFLGSGAVTCGGINVVASSSAANWNAGNSIDGGSIVLNANSAENGAFYDLTTNKLSNILSLSGASAHDAYVDYGVNLTVQINSAVAGGVANFNTRGVNAKLVTSDAALDLSHSTVSGFTVTSNNATGTNFTVHDIGTAYQVIGGSGTDTLTANGFVFSTVQRNVIFAASSIEKIVDASGTYTVDNALPTITSNGGGNAAAVSITENTTAVTTVTATDPDGGQTLSYSISGGVDASKFTIDATTGALSFLTTPNFELPTDAGGNNVYDVMVQASDGFGGIDTQAIAVTVTDVLENSAPSPQKIGTEFLVNTTTPGDQLAPVITRLNDGGFVVTWLDSGNTSFSTIRAQMFDALGAKVGNELLVSAGSVGYQGIPATTVLTDGGFVITWEHGTELGREIKAQIFDAIGIRVGGEFLVIASSTIDAPHITGLSGGGFVIAWRDFSDPGNVTGGDIKAQIFDASGTRTGSEFLVNTTTDFQQATPSITSLSNGGFVVTWHDRGNSTFATVKAQVFDAAGAKIGSEFLVSTSTDGDQGSATVTGLSSGGFVVSWADFGQGGDTSDSSVKAQLFDAMGTKVGNEFLVNTTVYSYQHGPSVTSLSNGGFVISWIDQSGQGGDSDVSIKAQLFDANGTKVGSEFLVNTTIENIQYTPSITSLSNGEFVVTWTDYSGQGGDNSGHSIKAQIFGTNSSAPVITTAAIQTIAESTQFVAALASTDVDVIGANPSTFSITGGTDAALFEVLTATDGSQSLQFVTAPDYETNSHRYQVEVSANDGINATAKLITVNLADVNEAPTAVALTNTVALIAENTSTVSRIKVGDISITDDAPGTNMLGLTGTDAAAFEIVGNALYLTAGTVLDFESKSSYTVAVVVDDPTVGGTIDAQSGTYVLTIGNVPGVTINGTPRDDMISPTKTVVGQPFPTGEADTIYGGAGNDSIHAAAGNDFIDGGTGADTMWGGPGNDTYVVDNGGIPQLGWLASLFGDKLPGISSLIRGDAIVESANEGNDTVQSSIGFTLPANVENLVLSGASNRDGIGNELGNIITGNTADNTLNGLAGADTLIGGYGNDRLIGGADADTLTGGPASDRFVFTALSDSTVAASDTITDFVHGVDVIDLSALDANSNQGGNQAFTYGGNNTSVATHGVTWFESGGNTIIQADVTGDARADHQIILTGINHHLAATDFFL